MLKEFLHQPSLLCYTIDSTVKYKKWISTGRSQLFDNVDDVQYFIDSLIESFFQDEVSLCFKKQNASSKGFKVRKQSLKEGEAVLVLNFGENYSFLVQDVAQRFVYS